MKLASSGALLVLAAVALPASAQRIDASTDVIPQANLNVIVYGQAQYFDADDNPAAIGMSGSVALYTETEGTIDYWPWITYDGQWGDSFDRAGNYDTCYNSGLSARAASGVDKTVYGSWRCVPPPPPPPPYEGPLLAGGEIQTGCPCTPLLIDFESGRYALSSTSEGVVFDINADGRQERVAWPSDPAVVAFLFADRNGNGLPDDGSDMFGDSTRLRGGRRAINGFEALAEFDADHDGVVTPRDSEWAALRLWFDRNRNGLAETGEIATLEARGVKSLAVSPRWTGRRDQHGNVLRWKAVFTRETPHGMVARTYYDAYLLAAQ